MKRIVSKEHSEQTTEQLYCCSSCKYFFGGSYCNAHTDCDICKMQSENGNCKCLGQFGYNCPYYEEV